MLIESVPRNVQQEGKSRRDVIVASKLTAGVRPEEELLLLLCMTAQSRRAAADRIEDLAGRVDSAIFTHVARRHRLLPLIDHRLEQSAGSTLVSEVRGRCSAELQHMRETAARFELFTIDYQAQLERAGIPTLTLKGPVLARMVYGDTSLRDVTDIDLLVPVEALSEATSLFTAMGYRVREATVTAMGLPVLHHRLEHPNPQSPPVELHWRVHWYETGFSRRMLERSVVTGGVRTASFDDEIASLLLYYVRDGFLGLRLAADIAAWWDSHRLTVGHSVLDGLIETCPGLGRALGAAAVLVDAACGVPAERLISDAQPWSARQSLALRLANPFGVGNRDERDSVITLVDWLLAPPGQNLDFVRRTLIPRRLRIDEMYDLSPGSWVRRLWWRVAHGPKMLLRYMQALAKVAGGGTAYLGRPGSASDG